MANTQLESTIDTGAVLDALDNFCEELYALAETTRPASNITPQLAYSHALQKALRMRIDVTKLLLANLTVA